jgi:hypothetical protein
MLGVCSILRFFSRSILVQPEEKKTGVAKASYLANLLSIPAITLGNSEIEKHFEALKRGSVLQ